MTHAASCVCISHLERVKRTPPPCVLSCHLNVPQDPSEWQYMYQQMVFGQLGSYALNMRSFGVPKSKVDTLVRQLAVGNGLSTDMLQVLLANSDATSVSP